MISRVWHGWTSHANAQAYEKFLHDEMLPSIHRVKGFKGAALLRRDLGNEIEFVTICEFDSIESVKEFAGEDHEVAVVLPEARKLLHRFDARSLHYETVFRID